MLVPRRQVGSSWRRIPHVVWVHTSHVSHPPTSPPRSPCTTSRRSESNDTCVSAMSASVHRIPAWFFVAIPAVRRPGYADPGATFLGARDGAGPPCDGIQKQPAIHAVRGVQSVKGGQRHAAPASQQTNASHAQSRGASLTKGKYPSIGTPSVARSTSSRFGAWSAPCGQVTAIPADAGRAPRRSAYIPSLATLPHRGLYPIVKH